MVFLRPAVAGDAAVMARIYIDSWNQGYGHLMGWRELTSDLVSRWEKDLTDSTVDWVIAEIDHEVFGLAGIGPSRDPIEPLLGELDTIAVDPTRWRQGVGRRLMDYERGHSFYRATGWKALGRGRADGAEVAFGHDLT